MQRFLAPISLSILALGAFGLAACGGDGDGPGSDEDYVRAVCSTIADLESEFEDVGSELGDAGTVDELNEALEQLGELLDDAAGQLDDANPPEDVRESHEQVVEAFRQAAAAMADGDIAALEEFDPDAFEPSADVQERLAAVAADTEECEGLGIFE